MNNHHRINYIEFPATDIEKTKAFYVGAFGWSFTDYGPDYTAFNDGETEGGFTTEAAVRENGALVILYSDNLEGSLESVVRHGGHVSKPIFEFPGGRRFHFTDPNGNELAVWSDR